MTLPQLRKSAAVGVASLFAVLTTAVIVGPAAAETQDAPQASFTTSQIRPITLPISPAAMLPGENGKASVYWTDTFGAARSGGRAHVGVDMMGPKMTPLVAAADGTVTWMRSNGNNMLVITDTDGWEYWYIHLNNDTPGTDDGANNYDQAFGPGIEVGSEVVAGQVVAYLGDSGNAEGSGSHLHFEIENPDGLNINPTLSVDDALSRLNQIEVDDELVAPFETFEALVAKLSEEVVGRPLTPTEQAVLAQAIVDDGLFESLWAFVDVESRVASIDRLYFAVFNRLPDLEGYRFWIKQEDMSLAEISEFFASSPEFETRFGADNYDDLLDQIYREMFGRTPDEEGKAFWLDRLEDKTSGVTPGTLVSFFSEGTEARGIASSRSELVAILALVEGRMPSDEEVADWQSSRGNLGFAEAVLAWFDAQNDSGDDVVAGDDLGTEQAQE